MRRIYGAKACVLTRGGLTGKSEMNKSETGNSHRDMRLSGQKPAAGAQGGDTQTGWWGKKAGDTDSA